MYRFTGSWLHKALVRLCQPAHHSRHQAQRLLFHRAADRAGAAPGPDSGLNATSPEQKSRRPAPAFVTTEATRQSLLPEP